MNNEIQELQVNSEALKLHCVIVFFLHHQQILTLIGKKCDKLLYFNTYDQMTSSFKYREAVI